MTNDEFDEKYAEFLNKFDDIFDDEENIERIREDVKMAIPTTTGRTKCLNLFSSMRMNELTIWFV